MKRRMIIYASLAGLFLFSAATTSAYALIAVMPVPVKVVQSDVIIEGRVVNIQDKTVQASVSPNAKNQVEYKVALVQVGRKLKGKVEKNLIKVGFRVPAKIKKQPVGNPRPVPIRIGGGRRAGIQLKLNQEGLFFLRKHHEADFYTLPGYRTFVSNENQETYQKELNTTKKTLRVLENPMEGLKAKDPMTRLETVHTLIMLYRTPPIGSARKEVPISAEESRLIMKTLADAEWDRNKYIRKNVKLGTTQLNNYQLYPLMLFGRLGINQKDGFQRPRNNKDYEKAAHAWVKKNWQTYRVKKYVAVEGKAGGPVQIQPVPGVPGRPPIKIQPIKGKIKIQPVPGKKIKKIRIQPIKIKKIKRIKVKPGQVQPKIQPNQKRPIQILPIPAQPAEIQPKAVPAPEKD